MPKLKDVQAGTAPAAAAPATAPRLSAQPPDIPRRDSSGTGVHVIGIDPGGKDKDDKAGHVGVTFARRNTDISNTGAGWDIMHICELTPPVFVQWFTLVLGMDLVDEIVCESFSIKKETANFLIGSELPTAQLIGYIRFSMQQHARAGGKTQLTMQQPGDRYVADGLLKAQGLTYRSPKTPDHARSSEMHLWTWLFRQGLVLGSDGAPVVLR